MNSLRIYLYDEPRAPTLRIDEIRDYIADKVPAAEVVARESFIDFCVSSLASEARDLAIQSLGEKMARAKVRNLSAPSFSFPPLPGEIEYERRRLTDPHSKVFGLLYDGVRLATTFEDLLPAEEARDDHIHIVFINQLIGTWDVDDRRYHARVGVYSYPSILSTTGLVEAPAKPRQFYQLKQQYAAFGMYDAAAVLKRDFQGRFIDHNDERITEAMKGYVMQAVFYHLTGDPFCQDINCRLYNAHWQEEVIRAQLDGEYEYCPTHEEMLRGGIVR